MTEDWAFLNDDATNSSGFTAFPGGRRGYNVVDFDRMGEVSEFWTKTINSDNPIDAYFFKLHAYNSYAYFWDYRKYWGLYVRCKQDN
jgi:uncharacterized protein (TIGR02145 family)